MGMSLNKQTSYQANQTRRLEVLHNCVKFIFENKISDARKVRCGLYFGFVYFAIFMIKISRERKNIIGLRFGLYKKSDRITKIY